MGLFVDQQYLFFAGELSEGLALVMEAMIVAVLDMPLGAAAL